MEPKPKGQERKTMITLWIDPSLVREAEKAADEHFNGNRSDLIREGVREIVARLAPIEPQEAEVQAA